MTASTDTDEDRYHDLIANYLRRIDAGEQFDRQAFIQQHAEFAAQLQDYFEGVDLVEAMAGPLAGTAIAGEATILKSIDSTRSTQSPEAATTQEIPENFGRYKILKSLGEGAMGAVYLAHDTQLDRQVALKIPKFSGGHEAELLERFRREARAAATLRHPHICPVFDVGEIEGRHYITMAFIEGRPLRDFSKAKKRQPQKQVALVIYKLAQALAEAHAHGVIHRDLKPANIMVDAKGEPVVMDFGLARRSAEVDVQVTRIGTLIGTPAYMSPEQFEGDQEKIGPAADIYSLGVIFYELLTGRTPFQGTLMSLMRQMAAETAQPLSQLRPDVDPRLNAICMKMIAKEIGERYASMKDVAKALSEYLKAPSSAATSAAEQGKPESSQLLEASQTTSREAAARAASALLLPDDPEDLPVPSHRTTPSVTVASQPKMPPTVRQAQGSRTVVPREKQDQPPRTPSTFPIVVEKEAPKRSPRQTSRSRATSALPSRKMAAIAGSVLLAVGLACGAVTVFARVGKVDVQITIDDPGVRVRFEGQTVTFETSGAPIKLKPGAHQFIVERDGLEVETDTFVVKKEGKNVLEVKLLDGKLAVAKDGAAKASGERQLPVSSKLGWHGWPADAPPPAIAPFDAEQAKKHQAAWAAYLKVPVEYTNSIGMKFRLIPPGEFMMGSTPSEHEESQKVLSTIPPNVQHFKEIQAGVNSALPRHRVILTKPIYLGVNEVTQAEYEAVMGSNPSSFTSQGAGKQFVVGLDTSTHPVEAVNWSKAVEFCGKLSSTEGLDPVTFASRSGESVILGGSGYRLPTEAEWEFACRAGTVTKFWTGDLDDDLARMAWVSSTSRGRTHPVGGMKANPFALYDMHGNVREWVQDAWTSGYYAEFQATSAIDPGGPSAGNVGVIRGGSYQESPFACRSSYRYPFELHRLFGNLGFRIAHSIEAVRAAANGLPAPTWQPTPAFQQWMDGVAKLPAEQQLEAVVKKLQELNAGYDGAIVEKGILAGAVSTLTIHTDQLADISPIAALKGLKRLKIEHPGGNGKLANLSPLRSLPLVLFRCGGNPLLSDLSALQGMQLAEFGCNSTGVRDLSPLRGMPLQGFFAVNTPLSDLKPLQGMPLRSVEIYRSQVEDLSPLAGCPIQDLRISSTRVTDLSPLKGMPLTFLEAGDLGVSDLSPLRGMKLETFAIDRTKIDSLTVLQGMPLRALSIAYTKITDLSPIKESPLKYLTCDFIPARDAEILRSIKTLETINRKPAAEVLKDAAPAKTTWQDWPADAPAPAIAPFDAPQAKKHQDAWAAYLKVPVEYTNSIGMKFRLIPPGEYLRGAGPADVKAIEATAAKYPNDASRPQWESESPQHRVILTRPLYVGVHEVTQENFEAVLGKNPSAFSMSGADKDAVAGMLTATHPIETVTWQDAMEFCNALSRKEKLPAPPAAPAGKAMETGYRLPTEAEWEFACRAGTTTSFWTGDADETLSQSDWLGPLLANANGRTHPVGGLAANPFGLHDMHGNVMEHCLDKWQPDVYSLLAAAPAVNPSVDGADSPTSHVVRGGAWIFSPFAARSSRRFGTGLNGTRAIGFRIVLPVLSVPSRGEDVSSAAAAPHRAAAEWALSRGMRGSVRVGERIHDFGASQSGQAPLPLPSEPYLLTFLARGLAADEVARNIVDDDLARLKSVESLEALDLFGCGITDAGLVHLKELRELQALNVSDTRVNGAGLAHLAGLAKLRALYANKLTISEDRLAPIQNLKQIDTLFFELSGISDGAIVHLETLPKLASLRLNHTPVTDAAMRSLAKVQSLQGLAIPGTMVGDEGMRALASLPALSGLTAWSTRITDAGLEHLSRFPSLVFLDIAHTKITDVGLSHLARCPKLASLRLHDTAVTDGGLRHLHALKTLGSLTVTETQVTPEGIAALEAALPKCQVIGDMPAGKNDK